MVGGRCCYCCCCYRCRHCCDRWRYGYCCCTSVGMERRRRMTTAKTRHVVVASGKV